MNTEINIYKILNEVTESSTIHEVSERLFLSEPYVSKTIKQAENKYDVILINRKTKPITLTKAGEIVLKNLRQIIEVRNELEYDLLPYKKLKNFEVRIALNQPWLVLYGKKLIEFLVKKRP